ncbi:MAG TPA: phospholipid carrier-dependent glycosyltransferase [Vicinamibacterales bacterium]
MPAAPGPDGRRILTLAAICAIAAGFRFAGLTWGAPYFHFHIDEHFVFQGADMLRRSVREAAGSAKFFMYGPLPMWILNGVRAVYERFAHPLLLTRNADEVTYLVMGRAISATLGTLSVPLAYAVARRTAGHAAGVLAALLFACTVAHLRESHFFTVDVSMLFFAGLAWLFAMRIVDGGGVTDYTCAGVALGAALACKYSALFVAVVIGTAHLCAAGAPWKGGTWGAWGRWIGKGLVPLVMAAGAFIALDPMAVMYFAKFRTDVVTWVVAPNSGGWRPIFVAQFADVHTLGYWFTNTLWWSLGPALELVGLAGVAWLLYRRDRRSLVAASFPLAYFVFAAQGMPFIRYAVPLAMGLAVSAGVMCADLLERRRLRRVWIGGTMLLVLATAVYAAAYMHVFLTADSRLAASGWLRDNVPEGAHILVEPSHNRPPTGSYLTGDVDFNGDYVMWGTRPSNRDRKDYYWLHTLDVYRTLYDPAASTDVRRRYIQSRLATSDWIVIDETFLEFYRHLPRNPYAPVKQYYRDLFDGRLDFALVNTFKVYPSLFGIRIKDDAAELTFHQFDHPAIFVFARTHPAARSE